MLVQARAVRPVAGEQEPAPAAQARTSGPVAQARLSTLRTYRKNDCPPPMGPHTWDRPAEQPVQGLPLAPSVPEPQQAQAQPGPTPRRSYRRTTRQRLPTPHRRGRWWPKPSAWAPQAEEEPQRASVPELHSPTWHHNHHKTRLHQAVANYNLDI